MKMRCIQSARINDKLEEDISGLTEFLRLNMLHVRDRTCYMLHYGSGIV